MHAIQKKKLKWLMSQKIIFFMITIVVVWGMYLLSVPSLRQNSSVPETEYIKSEIVKLSKQYVQALAKENRKDGLSTGKIQTAVLLTNMLDRIEQLENQLHKVIINSTETFATMVKEIKTLNKTILKIQRNKSTSFTDVCVIPNDPGYPHCAERVEWLKLHWKAREYRDSGVNGTICSILHYLSNSEDHCPKNYRIVKSIVPSTFNQTAENNCLTRIHDTAYPACKEKIEWMKQFWQSDPTYTSHGVDGSICSIVKFLSEVESWCPLMHGRTVNTYQCAIPKVSEFPHCGDKVAWMKKFWESDPCYAKASVNGSVCSFIAYLGEVEAWCPLLPGRKRIDTPVAFSGPAFKPDVMQNSLERLLDILHAGREEIKYKWMSARITRLWPQWLQGKKGLQERVKLDSYGKMKILIYIGLLADEKIYHFAEQATKGGPLGELVQWSDLIVSLYLLGHDITLSMNKVGRGEKSLPNILKKSITGSCPTDQKSEYDIIYTDYIGLSHMIRKFKNVNSIKCHLRLVDSFGTEAQFNHKATARGGKSRNLYGYHDLDLKQYNTMFPHSPDNTFLGFIVENKLEEKDVVKKKRIALVYGKHVSMWKDSSKIAFLDIVQRYFEVHATVGDAGEGQKVSYLLPRYVINHGVVTGGEYQKLLREATLFVGLGFPYEGPAPLEAIANGCFFLNAKLVPPLGRSNDKFFKQKPTERLLTSQHPYAERYIGAPYVYTVDLSNEKEVEEAMEDMETKAVPPHLPFEFTYEGMLERLYAFTKHHNFCNQRNGRTNPTWPPLSARKILVGNVNEGCDVVCAKKDKICEPAYFPSLNAKEHFPSCNSKSHKPSLVAPGIMKNSECIQQANKFFYSCTAKSEFTKRLCPCRDFVKGQTALCKDCLDGLL